MKRVEQMIKYLSGDLSPEESLAFERELSENPELKEEFSDVSLAYNTISDQLRKQDEEVFTAALRAAMKKPVTLTKVNKNSSSRWWYPLMAVAASVAILLTIIGNPKDSERLYSSSYHPSDDPVLITLEANTRGEAAFQNIVNLWQKKEFIQCISEAEKYLEDDPSDQYAMLFYLLSSMEMNQGEKALEGLEMRETDFGQTLGQALIWYKALALIRADEPSKAAALLTPLCEVPGPYKKDAYKLKKKLRK
jgi:hypothetical protein